MTEEWPRHGGQLQAIARRFGVSEVELLDFSANINPDGPPEKVWEVLRTCGDDTSVLTAYPDLEETELREAIGRAVGVATEEVAVANGFAPLLGAVLQAIPMRRCLLPVPCFGEYRRMLERGKVAVTTSLLSAENGFCYELDMLRAQVVEGSYDGIVLANPQNPSGVLCGREEMLEFVRWADERGTAVLLDEAFIDYAPHASLTARVGDLERAVVFRSVTKFYAVPGARVGYLVSNAAMAGELRERVPPWAISSIASRVVAAIIGDTTFEVESRAKNERRKAALADGLERLGIRSYPGAANFLLMQFVAGEDSAVIWERMIRERGLVLRSGANFEGLGSSFLRSAVRSSTDNSRLLGALAKVVATLPLARVNQAR